MGLPLPDRDQLRTETRCLATCVRDQLLALIPEDQIRGIYLTGSTVKAWDSPLDYVPEVSDVDIHVSFRDDSLVATKHLDTVPQALASASGNRGPASTSASPSPSTAPGRRLLVLNKLMAEREGLRLRPTVHRRRTPRRGLSPRTPISEPDTIRRHNAADLAGPSRVRASSVPLLAIDRPWTYSRDLLSQLTWRASPAGPTRAAPLRPRHQARLDLEPNPRHGSTARPGAARTWRTPTPRSTCPPGTTSSPAFTDTTALPRRPSSQGPSVLTEGADTRPAMAQYDNPSMG